MPKFDFSKLKDKLDIQGMVDSVKQIINPDLIPKELEGDPTAAKLALIKTSVENIDKLMEQQKQEMAKINALIDSIYKDMMPKKPGTKEPPKEE